MVTATMPAGPRRVTRVATPHRVTTGDSCLAATFIALYHPNAERVPMRLSTSAGEV
jgi:hypothetical protein